MTQGIDFECTVTCLTPQGRGAVAVISVEGPHATEQVARHFASAVGRPLASFPLQRIVFGRWQQSEDGGEDIVVCRTSETSVEVNCHGGVAAARAIVNRLIADGVVERTEDAWAASHCGDSIEAEARLALAEARTERTAAILLDQYRGALRRAIEASIDELERNDFVTATARLSTLIERADIGLHLATPWRIVFAGPPNVGKSSLMNRLLGYERSIVFDQPGTTRDLLTASTAFDGWPMELTDTAGLRDSSDAIEAEGVARATGVLSRADLSVLVLDATCDTNVAHEQLTEKYPAALVAVNKCDLYEAAIVDKRFLPTSALRGTGIVELIQQIVRRLVRHELSSGDAVPFAQRQVDAINSARQSIANGNPSAAIQELWQLIASSA
jgi:tRNA modification GTPase